MVIAAHLVRTGYGMWLSNDLRGSGSDRTRKDELENLGPIHHGRKPIQPSRDEIRDFYDEATPSLDFEPFWFRDAHRKVIGDAAVRVIASRGYTCWAFAVCSNHAHGLLGRPPGTASALRHPIQRLALPQAPRSEPAVTSTGSFYRD